MRYAALFVFALVGCIPGMQSSSWGVSSMGAQPTSVAPVPNGPVTATTTTPANNVVVYLHGGGGRILGGTLSDAPRWVSRTVAFHGLAHANFPAFEGTQDEWRYMMSCSQNYFAGFPVTLVDQQPSSGNYLLAVVSGSASILGTNAWGQADMDVGRITERATGFVFSADHRTDHRAQRLCESLTHEIGHMLGLDHADQCSDVMSANTSCVWDGASPGFLDHNRSLLAANLARSQATSSSARPVTPLELQGLGLVKLSDGTLGWPVNAIGSRPIARATTIRVAGNGQRVEWPCLPSGNGCDIVGNAVRSVHAITPGTWQVMFDVVYADGSTEQTGWATISTGGL
jgi:hypothetical protein